MARKRRKKVAKLGTGKRFAVLEKKLKKGGARDPAALAASIGRKKFGKKRFAALSARARKKKGRKRRK